MSWLGTVAPPDEFGREDHRVSLDNFNLCVHVGVRVSIDLPRSVAEAAANAMADELNRIGWVP